MKTRLYLLTFSLLGGLSLSQAYAQTTYYGTGAGKGGTSSTHIGAYAGTISTGQNNTFLGHISGFNNKGGYYNTFLGSYSGALNTTGRLNTFVGTYSGQKNVDGVNNTFVGTNSGRANTGGSNNTFLGSSSGIKNFTGTGNTFTGGFSGYDNTKGHNNAFYGGFSGRNNTTGSNNTFLGYNSGISNTTGENNVFIGHKAGYTETGSNRLYIDNNFDDKPLLYGNFYHNVLSIGTKYTGNTYKLVVPGKVRVNALDVVSDERVKKDIHPLQDVLTKVQQVKGVSYALKEEVTEGEEGNDEKINARTGKTREPVLYGFLAQNIQEVFPELVTEDEGMLAVNYQGMIPVLVEAVKELAAQKDHVTQLQAQVVELQQALATLTQSIRDGTSAPVPEDILKADLYQNHPNPFAQSTTIAYRVTLQAREVSLIITNLWGTEVQRFDRLPAGPGKVEVAAGNLAAGTYVYTLVVDGQPVAAHKMILSR